MCSIFWSLPLCSTQNLDKLTEIVAKQIQEVEEGTDVDPIVNAAFVKLVGESQDIAAVKDRESSQLVGDLCM